MFNVTNITYIKQVIAKLIGYKYEIRIYNEKKQLVTLVK